MKILFDHNTPDGLASLLSGHEVTFCRTKDWSKVDNGFLIAAAEKAGFDLMVTCDQNIRYQQNLNTRKMAIIELTTNHWPSLRNHSSLILAKVDTAARGSYMTVLIPRVRKRKAGRA